jgi:hypothetical protein
VRGAAIPAPTSWSLSSTRRRSASKTASLAVLCLIASSARPSSGTGTASSDGPPLRPSRVRSHAGVPATLSGTAVVHPALVSCTSTEGARAYQQAHDRGSRRRQGAASRSATQRLVRCGRGRQLKSLQTSDLPFLLFIAATAPAALHDVGRNIFRSGLGCASCGNIR